MTSTAELNKAIVIRLYDEAMNQARYESLADDLVAAHAVMHNAQHSDRIGPDIIKATWGSLCRAFGDLRFEVEGIVADDDQVAVRGTLTGTHTGQFGGIDATGRRVTQRAHVFYRLESGRVSEVWPMVGHPTLIQQIRGE
ncbi:ester cyclase [Kitasatospora sp. NPDC001119]